MPRIAGPPVGAAKTGLPTVASPKAGRIWLVAAWTVFALAVAVLLPLPRGPRPPVTLWLVALVCAAGLAVAFVAQALGARRAALPFAANVAVLALVLSAGAFEGALSRGGGDVALTDIVSENDTQSRVDMHIRIWGTQREYVNQTFQLGPMSKYDYFGTYLPSGTYYVQVSAGNQMTAISIEVGRNTGGPKIVIDALGIRITTASN